jgi:hypothetical protein
VSRCAVLTNSSRQFYCIVVNIEKNPFPELKYPDESETYEEIVFPCFSVASSVPMYEKDRIVREEIVFFLEIAKKNFTLPSPSTSPLVINLVSIFRCSSPPHNPVYTSRVDPSALGFSLSSHRHNKQDQNSSS